MIITVCLTVWGWGEMEGDRGSRVLLGLCTGAEWRLGAPWLELREPLQVLRTCSIATCSYTGAARTLLNSHLKGRC